MSHETLSHHVAEDPAEERLSRALRSLPARVPPAGLTTSLRVIASRERKRFLERRTLPQAFATWYQNSRVTAGEMIRNAALPVTGGLFTAVLLFSAWLVPTYPLHAKGSFDVPTMLSPTEATVQETAATGLSSGDAVDVTINDRGQVVDFSFVNSPGAAQSVAHRHEVVENLLLFTRFAPATEFGRPTQSKLRLLFNPDSQVDVKD
jgi:hypothetical protein